MYSETITQREGIVNGVPPQTLNNGSTARASTAGVDMTKFHRAFFTLYIGTVTAGSISAWLQESSDNFSSDVPSNDSASPFSNSSGSNLSSTANTTSNAIVTFEVRADQLTNGKKFVRLQVKETAGSNVIVSVTAFGDEATHKPGSAQNGTHVAINGNQKVVA
jgi:hypothetical protein